MLVLQFVRVVFSICRDLGLSRARSHFFLSLMLVLLSLLFLLLLLIMLLPALMLVLLLRI